ncbi:MAG: quinone-dependent dihydroorotate dehydrogenase [Pseudomonadota bacterium]
MTLPRSLATLGTRALTQLDPEDAHALTIRMMSAGLGPRYRMRSADAAFLSTSLGGVAFPNPLGLAAGFDKNAQAIDASLRMGFGFVEVGGVTPRPQPGNDRPRVFRLRANQAVINRYGFNNDGVDVIARRLRARHNRGGVVGVNLGANKDSEDRMADYAICLERLSGLADFFTVNVSSPNTPGLRALQDKTTLAALLDRVLGVAKAGNNNPVVFLKIAPDLTDPDKDDIVSVIEGRPIAGLIVSNTTIDRPSDLKGPHRNETGGLSGAPLFAPSTALLREFYGKLDKKIPLIGVGGISSGADAYKKILNGAQLVQLYTALIYQGPGLVPSILRDLVALARADGHRSIADAVGAAA